MVKHQVISEVINIINEYIYTRNWAQLDNYINNVDPYNQIKALTAMRASTSVKDKLPSYSRKLEDIQEAFDLDGKLHLLADFNA